MSKKPAPGATRAHDRPWERESYARARTWRSNHSAWAAVSGIASPRDRLRRWKTSGAGTPRRWTTQAATSPVRPMPARQWMTTARREQRRM